MSRYRRPSRPMWDDDFEIRNRMGEVDLEYEHEYLRRVRAYEYNVFYRRRMYELEQRERMHDLDLVRRRMLDGEVAFRNEREDHGILDEKERMYHPCYERGEDFDAPGSWNTYDQEVGQHNRPGEAWVEAEDQAWRSEWHGSMNVKRPQHPSDGAAKDTAGETHMDLEQKGDDGMTDEQKLVFKLKRATAIPMCYLGPHFDNECNEFTVQVSPVTYGDVVKSSFTSITANASSFRVLFTTQEDGPVSSSLVLMAQSNKIRSLLRGVMTLNTLFDSISVKVERRKAEVETEEDEPSVFPTVMHTASFILSNKAIRDHLNRVDAQNENSSEKQSAISLHGLPQNVDWTFLRILFPLSLGGQVVEGEPRSAVVQMNSPKRACLHVACITDLQIDGQLVEMKTDVPPQEAVQMLREIDEEDSQAPEVPKKKKKLSPSDIRRNLKRQQLLKSRGRSNPLPNAPAFPGIPNLLGMSFPGPGNTPAQSAPAAPKPYSPAAQKRIPGSQSPYTWSKANKDAGSKDAFIDGSDSEAFPVIPIPQILEGPYPAASQYYAPGTPSAPGTSQKIRTPGYFRRRGSRVAVYIAHLWGGNTEEVGKALVRSALPEDKKPPAVPAPPELFSAKPLTEQQLRKLRKKVKENVTMDEMRKAEEHWQRKWREKVADGRVSESHPGMMSRGANEQGSNIRSAAKVERDRKRMTEYNKKKTALNQNAPQATAGNGQQQASATAQGNYSDFQNNDGSSTHAGFWDNQLAPGSAPQAQQQSFQPPPKRGQETPQTQHHFQDQSAQQYPQPSSLMPPPPLPPLTPAQTPQNKFPQTPVHRSRSAESARDPSPRPTRPFQNQYPRPQLSEPARPGRPFQVPPRAAESSHTRFSHPRPPPPPRHQYSQQAAPSLEQRPKLSASQGQNQTGPQRFTAPQQQGSAYRWGGPGQQQQTPWQREPSTASSCPEEQGYSQWPTQQGFWQRGGVLNAGAGRQGNAEDQQSGANQWHYGQQNY